MLEIVWREDDRAYPPLNLLSSFAFPFVLLFLSVVMMHLFSFCCFLSTTRWELSKPQHNTCDHILSSPKLLDNDNVASSHVCLFMIKPKMQTKYQYSTSWFLRLCLRLLNYYLILKNTYLLIFQYNEILERLEDFLLLPSSMLNSKLFSPLTLSCLILKFLFWLQNWKMY